MKQGRCPICDSPQLGALESLADLAGSPSYQAVGTIDYRAEWVEVQHDPQKQQSQQYQRHRGAKRTTKAGTVEVLVCGECGRVETYVQDPQWLPFERLRGFTWVNPGVEETDGEAGR